MNSNNGTDSEDIIQHIDDALEEQQYVESFAPKAQEEMLSETQDGTQPSVSDNQYDNSNKDHDESIDLSNDEELNATSNRLVDDVITNVEFEKKPEENEEEQEEKEEKEEKEEEEVKVEEQEVKEEVKEEEQTEEKEEVKEEEQTEEKEEKQEIREHESSDIDEGKPDSDIVEEPSIGKEEISIDKEEESIEKDDEPIDNNEEEQLVVVVSNIELEKPDENIEVDSESNVTMEEPVVEDPVVNEKEEIGECVKVESNVKTSPIHVPGGKDIKSLSSTFKQDENITNGDCVSCNKIVYPLEKFVTKNLLYHKSCFRCTKCNSALTAGNFTFNKNSPYCQPHYVELFKKRGRYDETDENIETGNATAIAASELHETTTDELPARDTTKNLLAKFREREEGGSSNSNQSMTTEAADELPAPNTTKNMTKFFSGKSQESKDTKSKPALIDIPRNHNGVSNGTSENVPVELPADVVRANDPAQDERPKQGITKNIRSQFENRSNN